MEIVRPVRSGTSVDFLARISGLELACLSNLDAPQALLEALHLLFHYIQFDIQGLMKLHETIDMGCKPINSIIYYRESLVHFFSDGTNIKLKQLKSPVYLPESLVDLSKSPIHLPKSFIDLSKSPIRPLKSSPNKLFKRCKALIDGSSFNYGFLVGHLSYLAALSLYKSQDLKSKSLDHPIRLHQRPLQNRQAEFLRGLRINHQFKLHWLLHRQIGGLGAFKNLVH